MSRGREPTATAITWRELAALQDSLSCKEEQLLSVQQQLAADIKQQPGETREQLLVLRWWCLLEERKQLTALIRLAAGGKKRLRGNRGCSPS
jgi:hypothetical protein